MKHLPNKIYIHSGKTTTSSSSSSSNSSSSNSSSSNSSSSNSSPNSGIFPNIVTSSFSLPFPYLDSGDFENGRIDLNSDDVIEISTGENEITDLKNNSQTNPIIVEFGSIKPRELDL